MARRFAKVSEEEIVAINEAAFFYASDLVNTKTTIPLRVGEEPWIYTSTLRFSCIYPPLFTSPSGILVYYYPRNCCEEIMKLLLLLFFPC